MFSNFIDNIPKTTKKQESLKIKHLESLKNKADKIKENFDKQDHFVHPVVGIDTYHSHVELPKKTQDQINYPIQFSSHQSSCSIRPL